MSRIVIIGAGAWGTALAIALDRSRRHELHIWAHEAEVRESIQQSGTNPLFLPGFRLPQSLAVHESLTQAIEGAEIAISAMPSQHCRAVFSELGPALRRDQIVVSATKGLEQQSLLRMTEVICASSGAELRVGALSGPSFALEVARGDPTAVTIASPHHELMETIQREFSDASFRVYANEDLTGVELCGALKNIIAIAAGVCHGLGLGHNSVAGLITRGLAEMTRLVTACGGRPETMAGLAGLGDLVLTCTGELSRNRSVGVELGRGRKLSDILAGMGGRVAEGIFTTDAAVKLARAKNIEMPITEQIQAILNQGKAPQEAIHELMTRSSKHEVQPA